MSTRFESLYRSLFLALAAQAGATAAQAVGPSDCRPRDADSTCATAVLGTTQSFPGPQTIYDNTLGGVPTAGYSFWGYDFEFADVGVPNQAGNDMYINRSSHPFNVTLGFTVPVDHPCARDCLPGVKFLLDTNWTSIRPGGVLIGDRYSVTTQIRAGQRYSWVIGLWQATNPTLTVTVLDGSRTSLRDLGLPLDPSVANEILAVETTCTCEDGSTARCSLGSRYSNGLLGPWSDGWGYTRLGAFSDCPSSF